MESLSGYAHRPIPFVLRYLRKRLFAHLVIFAAVVFAVACSVGTQYGVKHLVDGLSAGPSHANGVWLAFIILISLIAADNFSVADRKLGREFHLCRRYRRFAPRPVPASHRSRAQLFHRTAAGHADQPHHGDLERGLHG